MSLFKYLPQPILILGEFVSFLNAQLLIEVVQSFSLRCLNPGEHIYDRFDTSILSCVDVSYAPCYSLTVSGGKVRLSFMVATTAQ